MGGSIFDRQSCESDETQVLWASTTLWFGFRLDSPPFIADNQSKFYFHFRFSVGGSKTLATTFGELSSFVTDSLDLSSLVTDSLEISSINPYFPELSSLSPRALISHNDVPAHAAAAAGMGVHS